MSERPSEPNNKSLLSPVGFKFNIQRLPHVNYFCTSANIPDVTLGQSEVQNPFVKLKRAGEKIEFSDLTLEFQVDEDMKNYQEIFDWIQGLGFPDNFPQRAAITEPYSDASLVITTAQYQPNIEIRFKDLYPTSLASLQFDLKQSDIQYLAGSVTFAYRSYDILTIT